MNKANLIKLVAKKFELSKAKSDKIIKHILESITDSLTKNKSVVLVGFGTFSVTTRCGFFLSVFLLFPVKIIFLLFATKNSLYL